MKKSTWWLIFVILCIFNSFALSMIFNYHPIFDTVCDWYELYTGKKNYIEVDTKDSSDDDSYYNEYKGDDGRTYVSQRYTSKYKIRKNESDIKGVLEKILDAEILSGDDIETKYDLKIDLETKDIKYKICKDGSKIGCAYKGESGLLFGYLYIEWNYTWIKSNP